jgi:hypothetical protein
MLILTVYILIILHDFDIYVNKIYCPFGFL